MVSEETMHRKKLIKAFAFMASVSIAVTSVMVPVYAFEDTGISITSEQNEGVNGESPPEKQEQEESSDEKEDSSVSISFKNPISHGEVTTTGQTNGAWEVIEADDVIVSAAEGVRKSFIQRDGSIKVHFKECDPVENITVEDGDFEKYNAYVNGVLSENEVRYAKLAILLVEEACAHTGESGEGDSLYHDLVSFKYTYTLQEDGSSDIVFNDVCYHTSKDDYEYVLEQTDVLINGITDLAAITEYAKAKAVYEAMVNRVGYDINGGNTAFNALESGKATEDGYALLGYELFNRAGIDARIIYGGNESWLVINVDGAYYFIDPVRDAETGTEEYRGFLLGQESMQGYKPDAKFLTDSFTDKCQISEKDYVVSTVTLEYEEMNLSVGAAKSLGAKSSDGGKIDFSSSDTEIAVVDENGIVTAKKPGDAVITAKTRDGEASCKVHVAKSCNVTATSKDNVTEYVSGSGAYIAGETVLAVAVRETMDGYRFVRWEISPDVVFTEGTDKEQSRIMFYAPEGDVSLLAVYEEIPVTGLSFQQDMLELEPGETKKLAWNITPANASGKNVKIESSNTRVVTVTQDGEVNGVTEGTADVTVSSDGVSAVCHVTVKGLEPEHEEHTIKVTGRNSSGELLTQDKKVMGGDTITISVPSPEKYGYKFKRWEPSVKLEYTDGYSDTDIRTSFLMPDEDLAMTATYSEIKVESIEMGTDDLSMNAGRTFQLKAKVVPSNALNNEISYSSSDESVAKVDSKGKITAVAEGTARIYASCDGRESYITVTVKGKGTTASGTEYLKLNATGIKIYAGSEYQLRATARNAGTISYHSSNSSVATVSSSGLIKGIAAGTCEIRAVSASGNTSDVVTVTVVAKAGQTTGQDTSIDQETLLQYKNLAAKYKADADRIRADALRKGVFVKDKSISSSDDTGSSPESVSVSGSTGSNDASETESGSVNVGAEGGIRHTASQPTGDPSNLGQMAAALSISLSSLLRIRKRKNRK